MIHEATYIHCYFLILINAFHMFSNICLYYFLILCSYFHLFLTLLATRHILKFTMFDFISLQTPRNITEIKKTLHSPRRKKKCRVNYNQNQSMSFSSLHFNIPYRNYMVIIWSIRDYMVKPYYIKGAHRVKKTSVHRCFTK